MYLLHVRFDSVYLVSIPCKYINILTDFDPCSHRRDLYNTHIKNGKSYQDDQGHHWREVRNIL